MSPHLGCVVGIANHYNATGITSQYQRSVVIDDAGRTSRIQYTGPKMT